MIKLTKPYTDRHGITFPAAVLVVTAINYGSSDSGTVNLDHYSETGEPVYTIINQSQSMNVGFVASIYASQDAFNKKLPAMKFVDNNGTEYFNLSLPVDTDVKGLVEICEAHLLSIVGVN